MIEKDNNFVKKIQTQTFALTKAIKSLRFGLVCNDFIEHCLCEKLKPWVEGWGRSNNSLNKSLWEPENTKQINKINHYQNN